MPTFSGVLGKLEICMAKQRQEVIIYEMSRLIWDPINTILEDECNYILIVVLDTSSPRFPRAAHQDSIVESRR